MTRESHDLPSAQSLLIKESHDLPSAHSLLTKESPRQETRSASDQGIAVAENARH